MSRLDELLEYNSEFVTSKKYEPYITSKYPDRHLAIVSCMDARMVELLPVALGIKNGDAKLIKNAGGLVTHQFGSAMRSLLVGVYNLQVKEILVIGHDDCGMLSMNVNDMLSQAREFGISNDSIHTLTNAGIDLETWFTGFKSVDENVMHSVELIRKHPLMPSSIMIHGLVMDPITGQVRVISRGE